MQRVGGRHPPITTGVSSSIQQEVAVGGSQFNKCGEPVSKNKS